MDLLFSVNKDAALVFDYLTDMQKFVSVHPVIFQIDKTGRDRYLIHETLKLGFIPFTFTYPATVAHNWLTKTVVLRAVVMRMATIEMRFALKADNGFTVVEEHIRFQSVLPVAFAMRRIFRQQHTQLFKNMELAAR